MILEKVAKTIKWGNIVFSTNGDEKMSIHMQNNEIKYLPHTSTKIDLKFIKR